MAKDRLLVFTGMIILIIGVIYPQEKNIISGIWWTWVPLWFGWCVIISMSLMNKINVKISLTYILFIFIICFIIFFSHEFHFDYEIDLVHFMDVFSVLLITTITVFLLLSSVENDKFFRLVDQFSLALCFFLLLSRIVDNDFSREGTFLGLGPLTFIKYISIGLLSRLIYIQKMSLIPLIFYGFAFAMANSKGPTLFLILTYFLFLTQNTGSLSFKKLVMGIVMSFLILTNDRFLFLIDEIPILFDTFSTTTITDSSVANEEISGTLVRIFAISESLQILKENPYFGIGPGRWPIVTQMPSIEYPHNSILEIWTEYGLLVFFMFFYLVWLVLKELQNKNILAYFAIFSFMTTLTSGSARDLRFFIVFALLCLSYGLSQKLILHHKLVNKKWSTDL